MVDEAVEMKTKFIKKVKFMKKIGFEKSKYKEWAWAYFMLFPTMLGLFILNVYPMIKTVILSFSKSMGFGRYTFTGLDNYKAMITDPMVGQATINTFKYALYVAPLGVFLSLVVSVLLNAKIKGKSIYRVIYFLPVVSAPAAVAMVWRWVYNSEYGIFNYLLSMIGVDGPKWLTDPNIALFSVAIVGIWAGLGYNMIILLAGLQEIPSTYYEAAEIDGAGPVRQFFSITLPLITPTLFFVVITTLIGALKVFDHIFMMMENTNPAMVKTQTLMYLFYRYGFMTNERGYASAVAVLLLVIILIVTLVQLKLQKKMGSL